MPYSILKGYISDYLLPIGFEEMDFPIVPVMIGMQMARTAKVWCELN